MSFHVQKFQGSLSGRIMKTIAHQYIKMSGNPYERGMQYGLAAKERIHKVIEEYKILFEKEGRMDWETAYRKAAGYQDIIEKTTPELFDEMRGIAEGAGVDLGTIVLLNCRSEVMFAHPADECAVIGIPQECSKTGSVLMAENWDWWSIGRGTTVILEIKQDPLPSALIITEAGLVGGKGLNSAGIGLTMNALSVRDGRYGLPLQLLLREALNRKTVPEALDFLARAKRAGSACVGLGSADGLLVMVEFAPKDLDILLSEGKPICHTNHWLSSYMRSGPEATIYSYRSTFTRLDRVRALTSQKTKFGPQDLRRILSDHAGYPDSVCRHDDEGVPEYNRHTSLWSMVLDLKKRTMWLTDDSPCMHDYRAYQLGD